MSNELSGSSLSLTNPLGADENGEEKKPRERRTEQFSRLVRAQLLVHRPKAITEICARIPHNQKQRIEIRGAGRGTRRGRDVHCETVL